MPRRYEKVVRLSPTELADRQADERRKKWAQVPADGWGTRRLDQVIQASKDGSAGATDALWKAVGMYTEPIPRDGDE